MGKLYSLISALLLTVCATFAAVPDRYEWWFDHDVSSVQTGSLSGNAADLEIDTSGLPKGIHYFNLRLSEGDSIYSSVYHKMFLTSGKDKSATSFEYWYDNDYIARVTGEISEGSRQLELDISSLPKGVHFFNCRFGKGDGNWGSVYSRMVLTIAKKAGVSAYEYWIDSNYGEKVSGSLTYDVNSYDIDFDSLQKGLHKFSYRLMTEEGVWGAPFTKYFYCASNEARFTEYEYWLDNEFANRITATTSTNPVSFDVDLSDFDKSGGAHYFHLRTRDGDGDWNPVYRKRLVFTNEEMPAAIVGYRHLINGKDLGYVELDRTVGKTFSFETSLPDRSVIFGDPDSGMEEGVRNDSIRYVVQLKSETGWMPPVSWDLDVTRLTTQSVRFSYNGRYLMMESDDDSAEIHYALLGKDPSEEGIYSEPVDVGGLATVNAWAVRSGYQDSEKSELVINRYANEEHAETAAEGLLASAFVWNQDVPNNVEDFRIEGRLNDADYAFIRSMGALRHLDIEDVSDAHIPDNAFRDSRLISISLPADIAECGDGILSGSPLLSSVIWNSRTMDVGEGLTRGLTNPNVLLYVPEEVSVSSPDGLNIVKDDNADSIILHYGHPYYAARDFRAGEVSLTHDFTQTTIPDICRGWETIVLPFTPTDITHEVNGPAVPFAAWNEDIKGDKPFWLYSATSGGWEAAGSIEACVPYIISMPNNPDYVAEFNLGGKVTFSAEGVYLGPDRSLAKANSWIDGTMFEGTFMPVDSTGILSLNVGSTEGDFQPGSTFVPDGLPVPFGAYVSGAGRKAMPLFGGSSSVDMPLTVDAGLLIETPAPGTLRISSGRERRVAVTTVTGVTIRTLRLKPGEFVTLEGLTRDLYIVGGRKVMVR